VWFGAQVARQRLVSFPNPDVLLTFWPDACRMLSRLATSPSETEAGWMSGAHQRLRNVSVTAVIVVALVALTSCEWGKAKPSAQPPPSGPAAGRLRVDGENLVGQDGKPIVLRGFNFGWWGEATESDADEAKRMGANVVRLPLRWYFEGDKSDQRDPAAPGNIKPDGLATLDQTIDWLTKRGIWVILFMGADRGAGNDDHNFWTDKKLRDQYLDTWQFLATRYRSTPYIAAYELLSEPHPKKPYTAADVRGLYDEAIARVRTVDSKTPLIVGANDHYDIGLLDEAYTDVDHNIVYTANFYLPTEYIKPDKQPKGEKPLVYGQTIAHNGTTTTFDAAFLESLLEPAKAFRAKRHVPVFINQVGARSALPGALAYTHDVLDVLTRNSIGFAWWTFRTRSTAAEYGIYWQDDAGAYHRKDDLAETLQRSLTTAYSQPMPSPSRSRS
jgi:aryl-phospho-beta-D-glucosidase BglC (GH1 family)